MQNQAILRAVNANGDKFFWTGKAGAGWVSEFWSCSFATSAEHAARRVSQFNAMTPLHGLTFEAVAIDGNECA